MEPSIFDQQRTSDSAQTFLTTLTRLHWFVLSLIIFYTIIFAWPQQWQLDILCGVCLIAFLVIWYAQAQIARGNLRSYLVVSIGLDVLILSIIFVVMRDIDATIVLGFSIPLLLSTLLPTPRYTFVIVLWVSGLYASVMLFVPMFFGSTLTLDPSFAALHQCIPLVATLGIVGMLSWQLVRIWRPDVDHTLPQSDQVSSLDSALYEARACLRSIFHDAAIGMAVVELDGRWRQVNPILCDLLGYSEDELRTTTFQALTHPDDLATDEAYVEQLLRGDIHTYQMEKRYLHKAGHSIWATLSVTLVRDTREQPLYFIAQVLDSRARKDAEIELTHSYANNYALLEALPDTLYRFSADGRLQDYKAGHTDELTLPSALFLGQHITNVFPSPIATQVLQAMEQVMQTGRIQIVEQAVLIQEVMHDYECRIVSSGSDTVLVLVRDITERKAIEHMKDEFVATVSHELRTPLTAIHGALGLVSAGVAGSLSTQAHTMVDIALSNSGRLIRLINDLLDLQKIDAGQFTIQCMPLALRPLLERTIATNVAYGQQFGVTFRLECAHRILLNTDPDRLMQVLTNLLSNATKFSPPGGIVTIRVNRYQHYIRIAVIDHGPGIPVAFQPKLFQKFAQADGSNTRRSGGTGLGLSIAKKLIERLDGRIGFETIVGVGTTFYVDLAEWHGVADNDLQEINTVWQ